MSVKLSSLTGKREHGLRVLENILARGVKSDTDLEKTA